VAAIGRRRMGLGWEANRREWWRGGRGGGDAEPITPNRKRWEPGRWARIAGDLGRPIGIGRRGSRWQPKSVGFLPSFPVHTSYNLNMVVLSFKKYIFI
jgi:hypothetical protein